MLWRNTAEKYGIVTKTFHWLTALLVIAMLCLGFYMSGLPLGLTKLKVVTLHKSIGATILVLTVLRILWHIFSRRPKPVSTLSPFERLASGAMHVFLYGLLLVMPLTGWLFSSFFGRTVEVFGLFHLPNLVAPDKIAGKIYEHRHETLAWVILCAVALHVLAALNHHFRQKDSVLRRMLPFAFAALLVALPLQAHAARWNVLHEKSSITFHPKQMGIVFDGAFDTFSAAISFSPQDLAHSAVRVAVQTASAHTGAPDRDSNLKGAAWLDVAEFPEVIFASKTFHKTGKDAYVADGTLTVRGVPFPLALPFTLHIAEGAHEKTATMDAHIVLDRAQLKIGTGEWVDASIIANEIPVDIHVVALAAENQKQTPAKK